MCPNIGRPHAYGIANRADEPVLELCHAHNVAFVSDYPLGSAFTGGPQAIADAPAIASVAARHGATGSQIALAWLLAHCYERMLVIPGTSSLAHLEENSAVDQISLDAQDLAALDHVAHRDGPAM